MTQREMLLIVAGTLPRRFRPDDLAVAAWKRFPDAFSMNLYKFPSTQKVFSCLCHKVGPVRYGWLTPPPVMSLTAAGRAKLDELLGEPEAPADCPTDADRLWAVAGGRDLLTPRHAAEFFGLAYPVKDLAAAAEVIVNRLGELAQVDTTAGRVRYHLADYLSEKFGRSLGLNHSRSRM